MHNEGKSLVAERFTFTNASLKYQKNGCIDKLDGVINKYNNTYRSIIKMEPVDLTSSTYWFRCKK